MGERVGGKKHVLAFFTLKRVEFSFLKFYKRDKKGRKRRTKKLHFRG
jgi:hypothetical protein